MNALIETERLRLRSWSHRDRDDIIRIYSKPEVVHFLGRPTPFTPEDAEAFLKRRIDHEIEDGICLFAVDERDSGRLVGACGLQRLDGGPKIEVGYHFDSIVWGRGYATEAARACLEYGFQVKRIERIHGIVNPENRASKRVLEKIGLRLIGPAHYHDQDVIELAIDREDWISKSGVGHHDRR